LIRTPAVTGYDRAQPVWKVCAESGAFFDNATTVN
jgi:hypothetical protein